MLVTLHDIEVWYNDRIRLSFPAFRVEKGKHSLILGGSGSGKTTLLHVMCGLLAPSCGTVTWQDVHVYQLSSKQMDRFRGQHIGLVFQQNHLIKSLTVLENLQLAKWLAGSEVDTDELMALLERLDMADKASSYPFELSQGQRQRTSIARALVNRPALLVADEPTSALDDRNTDRVIHLLSEQAAAYDATLVIATHDKRIKDQFSNTYEL